MTPENAQQELETRIQQTGTPMSSFTPAQGMRLMLDFYRDVRADGCALDEDGDMLLFQWGADDIGDGRFFEWNLTRQFIAEDPEDEEGDSVMSQLSLTFHFTPSTEFDALKSGNRWCAAPRKLEYFEAYISGSDAYQAVATERPAKVALEFDVV